MASEDKQNHPPPSAAAETAPDPDEDDLDDLDEMLDEFSNTKLDSAPPPIPPSAPEASGPGRPAATEPAPPGASTEDDDFAKQLEASMADMVRELESNPEMAKQMEEFMAQFGLPGGMGPGGQQGAPTAAPAASSSAPKSAGVGATTTLPTATAAAAAAAPPPPPSAAGGGAGAGEEAFQDAIRRTIDRMQASSDSATAATAAAGQGRGGPGEDDVMAQLLQELASANPGADGDDTFSKMLMGMMEQLTNKEILYEPMKELDQKFPGWLEQNKGKLSKEDEERYATQRVLVGEIVGRFEREAYSDDDPTDREYIVERMQKMQASGAPPSELVGDTTAANDMMNEMDQGCSQQ